VSDGRSSDPRGRKTLRYGGGGVQGRTNKETKASTLKRDRVGARGDSISPQSRRGSGGNASLCRARGKKDAVYRL